MHMTFGGHSSSCCWYALAYKLILLGVFSEYLRGCGADSGHHFCDIFDKKLNIPETHRPFSALPVKCGRHDMHMTKQRWQNHAPGRFDTPPLA